MPLLNQQCRKLIIPSLRFLTAAKLTALALVEEMAAAVVAIRK